MRMVVISQYGDIIDPASGVLPLGMMAACDTYVTKHPTTGEAILVAVLGPGPASPMPWQIMQMLQNEH